MLDEHLFVMTKMKQWWTEKRILDNTVIQNTCFVLVKNVTKANMLTKNLSEDWARFKI